MKCEVCGFETENKKAMSNHKRYGCGVLGETKRCNKCRLDKKVELFSNNKRNRDGKHHWCKECSSILEKEWRLKNPDRQRTPEAKKKHAEYFQRNKKEIEAKRKTQYMELKIKALTHYSGGDYPHCVKCGIDDVDVLCLDHINGGGTKERRQTNRKDIHRILYSKNYPDGFQTLCANCNLKKEMIIRRGE